MTIVGIPTFGEGGLDAILNPRFGRCESFTFVTIENNEINEVRIVYNQAVNSMGGAGIEAAQIIGNNGATEVIVGYLGPNAIQALNSLNLKVFQAPNQQVTVKQCIELYLQGKLEEIHNSNVTSHFGMGQGRGMGVSPGMGGDRRGLGGGGRRRV